ncbi:MAG: [protein-PII] uridylyltransferase [Aestuariivirga sp.]
MKPTSIQHPERLIDAVALREKLNGLVGASPSDLTKIRPATVDMLKAALASARAEAENRLRSDGKGTQCAKNLAYVQDKIICALYEFAREKINPKAFTSELQDVAIIATGGYGRGTLAPGSDIDLLFLLPGKQDAASGRLIEFILYTLWDMRLKVGHATRSTEECIRLAKTDNTILTSILEARFICGNERLSKSMQFHFRRDIVQAGARKFVADKLAERDIRLAKSGESRYLVEPDLKDGKGGLRDLHTLFWIAKFLYDTNSPEELADKGAFTHGELARFQKCEDFLWAVRCHLHFIAGRGEDRLSFDRQSELASRLGYQSHAGLKNVERFMKHYFLIAKEVGDLTRIFCASLEAKQVKEVPVLSRVMGRFRTKPVVKIPDSKNFRIESGRLTLANPSVFQDDPVNLLRLFSAASTYGVEIHPDALKTVRKSLSLINKELCNNPEANALFLDMLVNSESSETLLRMMNEAGVLGRFIPEFGKVVAMMQFNMYHHYTVDEHLIRSVGILAALEKGQLSEDHPLAAKIFPTLKSRRSLYVAVLLHDIAKGRTEDHSIAGERIARALGPRFGLTPAETETTAWLIRHHLLMSETAQMRDLNDFKTILDFTAIVQSPERLKLLLILTVVDIRAVGPGVWNGWKGQLLRTLYFEAEPVLTGGHTESSREERVKEAQASFLAHFPQWSEAEIKSAISRHYDAYWLNVSIKKQIDHQALIDKSSPRNVVTEVHTDAFTAITELTVYAPDHPRLLALITGACAAANANIMGAQIFTTTDGMALDTILIQREFSTEDDEQRRAERVTEIIRRALQGKLRLKDAVANATHQRPRLQAFSVEPRVIIDNQSSNRFTVIEINGLDRIGLLYHLTEALFHLSLNIASAHITTFGEKAIDVFYVTDLTGDKILNPVRHAQIERELLKVLAPAVEKLANTA